MNILCIGDTVGRAGVEMVAAQLKYLKQDYNIDFVIVNGENAASGNGINKEHADMLLECGVDIITLGNHAFSKKDVTTLFENNYPIIRPLNMQANTPGDGVIIKTVGDKKIAVINLMGRVYMQPCDCPFTAVKNCIEKIHADIIFVDFHAEATSEKKAMGYFLEGKATCVFGTHTHVQTADECILGNKTAYITDLGMTGPYNSVLGVKKEISVRKFVTMMHEKYEVANGICSLNAIVVSLNDKNIPIKINRINLK